MTCGAKKKSGPGEPLSSGFVARVRLERQLAKHLNDSSVRDCTSKATVRRGGAADSAGNHPQVGTCVEPGVWNGEVRVIKDIVEISTELESETLGKAKVLPETQIGVEVARPSKGVPRNRCEGTRCLIEISQRDASSGVLCAILYHCAGSWQRSNRLRQHGCRNQRTGLIETAQGRAGVGVDETERIACVIEERAGNGPTAYCGVHQPAFAFERNGPYVAGREVLPEVVVGRPVIEFQVEWIDLG